MSNSKDSFDPEQPVVIKKNPPLPMPGYGLIFSESLAQEISEFVATPLFKKLKRAYALQRKDSIARRTLQSAQNVEWLMYYKGQASAVSLFFDDMEAVKKAFLDEHGEKSDRKESSYKK